MISDFFLVLALVTDAFIACFAYGTEKIRIPFGSALLISGIGTGILLLSMLAATPFQNILSPHICSLIGNLLLFLIGLLSSLQNFLKSTLRKKTNARKQLDFHWSGISFALTVYLNETEADFDRSKTLSLREAATLGAVLSLDSFGIGFGSGFLQHHYIFLIGCSLLLHTSAILLACFLGQRTAGKLPGFCTACGGILLMILAISKFCL
ncbi:MAG: sporulation protein [Candidatus Merdivicinus sp.]|jgi:putative sporulation protein YtaF